MMRCCCSVAQLRLTLFDPMDCSTSGLSVPHCLLKFTQVHVHCIGDSRMWPFSNPPHSLLVPVTIAYLFSTLPSKHGPCFVSVTCSFKDLASVPSHLITYPTLILPSWKVPFVSPPRQSSSSHNLCPFRPPTSLWSYHILPCITSAFMSVTSLKLDRKVFFFFGLFFISSFFRANTAFYLLLLLLLFSCSVVSDSLWPHGL